MNPVTWVLVIQLITNSVPGDNNGDPPMRQSQYKGYTSERACIKAGEGWMDRQVGDERVVHATYRCEVSK